MLTGKRVLIVEQEFLIALDIQRILEGLHAARTVFARSVAEAAELGDRWDTFDLAIIELFPHALALDLIRHLLERGIGVVGSTPGSLAPLPGLPQVPLVGKPFSEPDLVAACLKAAATASPDQAENVVVVTCVDTASGP